MSTYSTYQDAADSIAEAIAAGDADPSEFDMAAIETALIQRFQSERGNAVFYVAAAEVAASDYDELAQALEEFDLAIAEGFWAVIAANQN